MTKPYIDASGLEHIKNMHAELISEHKKKIDDLLKKAQKSNGYDQVSYQGEVIELRQIVEISERYFQDLYNKIVDNNESN
ncbi:hypothetical protein CN918_28345 [Priestia megaterium]|nr:hypothetical protein CN918_28345 [Priestia megaterium]